MTDCSLCDGGFYCPGPANTSPTKKCSPGYYCKLGAAVPMPNDTITGDICPEGKFCSEGSTEGEPCPKGRYGDKEGLEDANQCQACPKGFYCPTTGLKSNEVTLKCDAGYWCKGESPEKAPDNKTYGVKCPEGNYCPEGTPDPRPCSSGTYQPYIGKMSSDDCLACEPGFYCDNPGSNNMTEECNEGYYCLGNATTPNPTDGVTGDVCPAGFFCEKGSKKPAPCPSGTYMNKTGGTKCLDCPPGYQCTRGVAADPCKQGYYCTGKTGSNADPCPSGTFGARNSLKQLSECTQCTGGSYCDSSGLSKPRDVCDPGYFCQIGVDRKSPQDGDGHKGTGDRCPKGHECPSNTTNAIPCAPGTYAAAKGMA
jgi:hypothetical protein